MINGYVKIGAFSALISFGVFCATASYASESMVSASACALINPDFSTANHLRAGVKGLMNDSSSKLTLSCPVPHGSAAYADQYTTLEVYTVDGNNNGSPATGSVEATAIVHFWNGSGGRASTTQVSSASGVGSYIASLTGFFVSGDRGDFASIWVSLPPPQGSSASLMSGIWYVW